MTFGNNTVVGDDLGRAERLVDEILAGRYKTGALIPLWDGHAAERVDEDLAALAHRRRLQHELATPRGWS